MSGLKKGKKNTPLSNSEMKTNYLKFTYLAIGYLGDGSNEYCNLKLVLFPFTSLFIVMYICVLY